MISVVVTEVTYTYRMVGMLNITVLNMLNRCAFYI
jgi:hypothetical protein